MADPKQIPEQSSGPGTMVLGGTYGHRTVARNVKVTYTLDHVTYGTRRDGTHGASYTVKWVVTYHYGKDDAEEPIRWQKTKDDDGNSLHSENFKLVFKWDKIGHHRVHCLLWDANGAKAGILTVDQRVAEMETILQTQLIAAQKNKLSNPDAELVMLWKWRDLLNSLAEKDWAKMRQADKDAHQKRIKELVGHAHKLKDVLSRSGDVDRRWPFRAVYLGTGTMEQRELRVFITQKETDTKHVRLVDWTNLEEKELHGEYEVPFPQWEGRTKGQLIKAAIEDVIKEWKKKNKYAGGAIKYDFKGKISGYDISLSGMFDTGGTSLEEDVINFLKRIAQGAAYIGLFLTGVGSPLAGAFLVASMVAGTTGAVLSIHHRHSKGEDEYFADLVDVLDVAANLLGVGARAGKAVLWTEGRTIRMKAADKVVEAVFVGEAWASGFNGVLMSVQTLGEYNSIMNANMMPEARANALLRLFGSAAQGHFVNYINHKMATGREKVNWQEELLKKGGNSGGGGGGGKGGGKGGGNDGVPQHIDDPESGFHQVPSDGVPKPVKDKDSSFHEVPSDGVPKRINDNPNLDTRPNRTKVPDEALDKTVPINAKEKPGFNGQTKKKEKKVVVVTKEKRQPTGTVKPVKEPPHNAPKTSPLKRLGLGLLSETNKKVNYIKWSAERGFQTYGKLSSDAHSQFPGQIAEAMRNADEIHFNLERVKFDKKKLEGKLNTMGEPESRNYTNYELYLLSTNRDFARKVKWWNSKPGEGSGSVDVMAQDPHWWPPGLDDPR